MPHQAYIGSDGKPWPSATELTGLLPQVWLWSWYKASVKKQGWRGWQRCLAQSKRGMRIGTEVHGLLESFIDKTVPPFVVSGKYESEAFADALFDKVNPLVTQWGMIEPHVVSNKLKLHGTADAIVDIFLPGESPEHALPTILDWKTSAAKSETHPIQLAIYALCWNETEGSSPKVERGIIARIDKKSKKLGVKLDIYDNLEQYYPVIIALRTIWAYSNKKD